MPPSNVVVFDFRIRDGVSGILLPMFTGAERAEQFVISLHEQGVGMTPMLLELDSIADFLTNL